MLFLAKSIVLWIKLQIRHKIYKHKTHKIFITLFLQINSEISLYCTFKKHAVFKFATLVLYYSHMHQSHRGERWLPGVSFCGMAQTRPKKQL